jgi:hypothetical protein
MDRTTILKAIEEEIKGKRPVGQQKVQEGTRRQEAQTRNNKKAYNVGRKKRLYTTTKRMFLLQDFKKYWFK